MDVITDYGTFLREAKTAVLELRDMQQQEQQLLKRLKQDQKQLETDKKAVEDRISQTTKKRLGEITASYDKELGKGQDQLKKVRSKREKAKNQGVKERIIDETSDLRDLVRKRLCFPAAMLIGQEANAAVFHTPHQQHFYGRDPVPNSCLHFTLIFIFYITGQQPVYIFSRRFSDPETACTPFLDFLLIMICLIHRIVLGKRIDCLHKGRYIVWKPPACTRCPPACGRKRQRYWH